MSIKGQRNSRISQSPRIGGMIPAVTRHRRVTMSDNERQEEDDRFTASLAGLAMAIFLGVVGFYLAEQLAEISKREDCLLQGRLNCERIELSGGFG
jgi:hypothetical protein